MLVLDTNHLTELERGQAGKGMQLMHRLHHFPAETATTVITVEEQLAGRIAQIRSHRELHDQLVFYRRLQDHVEFFASWLILPFDAGQRTLC
jgi:predicted nucleic acid-binding protein